VVVEQDAAVAGDVTTVLGDARIEKGAKVSGDVTVFGGVLRRHPEATISGDVTNFTNKFLVILMMTIPVVVLGLVIALIVWLVQRSRRRASVAVSSGNFR
jgi:heme/copper-type cytochrome/quinol oxidase subunit 2